MQTNIMIHDLLAELIFISNKSNRIARHFRSNHFFDDFIQEKTETEDKNPRFVNDFKTLADVLIQQVTIYWLDKKFPGICKSIYGEESNEFKIFNHETIILKVDDDPENLKNILEKVLNKPQNNENSDFIRKLHEIVYEEYSSIPKQIKEDFEKAPSPILEMKKIALWIDPIDSTSEYIHGNSPSEDFKQVGLHCVTCLFGVFDLDTGLPLLGVISQPFGNLEEPIWGYRIGEKSMNNIVLNDSHSKIADSPVLVGKNESEDLLLQLQNIANPLYVAGAGHKLLLVIQKRCQALVTSSKTTYFWDTCAAHAILLSLGGGIVSYDCFTTFKHQFLTFHQLLEIQIRYKSKECIHKYNNCNGLIAYSSVDMFNKLCAILKKYLFFYLN